MSILPLKLRFFLFISSKDSSEFFIKLIKTLFNWSSSPLIYKFLFSKFNLIEFLEVILIKSKDFLIKGKFGPVGGQTYYSTSTFESSSNDIADYATTTAPLNSFGGPGNCTAYTEDETVTGGTISAYLLNSSGTMLVNNEELSKCSGQVKLLGVMEMSSALSITENTKGLKMTFVVTNNGMSVVSNRTGTEIYVDSGPFSVSFDTF